MKTLLLLDKYSKKLNTEEEKRIFSLYELNSKPTLPLFFLKQATDFGLLSVRSELQQLV